MMELFLQILKIQMSTLWDLNLHQMLHKARLKKIKTINKFFNSKKFR